MLVREMAMHMLFYRMFSGMNRAICYFEVFNSIVSFYAVKMVNNFGIFELTSDMVRHYKTMLKDVSISSFWSTWMIWISQADISKICLSSSTFPSWTHFTKSWSKFLIAVLRTESSPMVHDARCFASLAFSFDDHLDHYILRH